MEMRIKDNHHQPLMDGQEDYDLSNLTAMPLIQLRTVLSLLKRQPPIPKHLKKKHGEKQ